jgi:hypothetical protein
MKVLKTCVECCGGMQVFATVAPSLYCGGSSKEDLTRDADKLPADNPIIKELGILGNSFVSSLTCVPLSLLKY